MNSTANNYSTNNSTPNLNRNTGLDIARIIAMIAVVFLHSSQTSIIKMFTSFCVLLFVMVSGALWLDENNSVSSSKLIKSIIRIVVAFIFWSTIYTILAPESKGVYSFIRQIIIGPFHFWYCYMIIGLYAILPILKQIQKNKKIFIYFFIISFLTAILLPTLSAIAPLSGFIEIIDRSQICIGLGYVFYFILGYFLNQYKLPTIIKIISCLLGIISFIAMFFTNLGADFNILRTFYVSAIFIFSIELGKLIKSPKMKSVIAFFSKQCFTVYLIHILILYLLGPFIANYTDNEFLFCSLIVLFSFACAAMLNIIWKYIVKASNICITKQ
ncbi:MAG: acyltransferase family protein [Lachnospiraceae bacterium]|nr:acyltransferase family protein [Lachnospiraceae bacterium]